MAAPFNGEEFYAKRSIFTSLLGLKFGKHSSSSSSNKTAAYTQPQPTQTQYIPTDEPCSSRSLLPQAIPTSTSIPTPVPLSVPVSTFKDPYRLSAGDFPGRERTLSEQLADTLLLASPEPPQQILSPQDIYKEIVCECAHFEQTTDNMQPTEHNPQQCLQQNAYLQPMQSQIYYQDYYNSSEPPMPYSAPVSSPLCPHCHSTPEQQKNNILGEIGGKTTLEDLVKLVVAAVKDAGMLGKNDKKVESPEEILRRKRQQNNEAAARYRKRQREAKMTADSELDVLAARNLELRNVLSSLQDDIDKTKDEMSRKRILKADDGIGHPRL